MTANRMILLNQMAGPLFRELAEGLAPYFADGCILLTGHPDTVALADHVPDGLIIQKAPAYDRRSLFRRFTSWISYLFSSTRYILGARKSDAFLIVSNPPVLGAWFWCLNCIRKSPYVVLVYDIHPDVLVSMKIIKERSPVVWLWRRMNRLVYRDARKVITIGGHLAKNLSYPLSDSSSMPIVIPAWADVGKIKPVENSMNPLASVYNPDNKTVVLYSGNMGLSHDIESILEAARLLQDRSDLLFLFFGSGEKWQHALNYRETHHLQNIQVHPFQKEDNLPYTMALATISIVTLDEGAEGLMVPSKLFYYMAAGSAVIGICKGENELRDVLVQSDCGVCVKPKQPESLVQAIVKLSGDQDALDAMRVRSRRHSEKYYSTEVGVDQFVQVLRETGLVSVN
jgi:colanic acid biosynthesis glycosyl transferase WcaI